MGVVFCEKCGEPLDETAKVCTNCGEPISARGTSLENDEPGFSQMGKTKQLLKKLPLVMRCNCKTKHIYIAITMLVFLVLLVFIYLSGIFNSPTELKPNTQIVELTIGEEKSVFLNIENAPRDSVITYDDCSVVEEKWMDWSKQNESISLSLTGLTMGTEQLHIYIYDKKDPEKKAIAETFISVDVRDKSTVAIKTDNKDIALSVGGSATVMIALEGELPDEYYLSVDVPESILAEWGDWEANGNECPITFKGISVSTSTIKISLYDSTKSEEGTCLCFIEIPVTVK